MFIRTPSARTGATAVRIASATRLCPGIEIVLKSMACITRKQRPELGRKWDRQVHWPALLMHAPYHSTVAILYQQQWMPLQQWLARHFPRTSAALVEDAVSDAFHDALAYPASFTPAWKRDDHPALVRLLRQVAWRRLRGRLRKKSSQCEVSSDVIEPLDVATPDVLASSRELTLRVHRLVDQAARRFGGTRSQALRAALYERLEGGTDTEAARAHGVPREYVNRAKRWIATHLFLS